MARQAPLAILKLTYITAFGAEEARCTRSAGLGTINLSLSTLEPVCHCVFPETLHEWPIVTPVVTLLYQRTDR